MPIITIADVRAELPTVQITASSQPSENDVEGYITDIEAQVYAQVIAGGQAYPTLPSQPGWTMLRRVILEGVRFLVLRAKFALAGEPPPEVAASGREYERQLTFLGRVGLPMQVDAGGVAVYSGPLALGTAYAPALPGSFDEWTRAVDRTAQRLPRNAESEFFRP